MTRRQLRGLVKASQRRLGLEHWAIEFDFGARLATAHAEVQWSWSYDSAVIRFDARQWPSWSPDLAALIVAHELLHLVFRDLTVATAETVNALPRPAQRLACDRIEHEMEGVTERLAALLVKP